MIASLKQTFSQHKLLFLSFIFFFLFSAIVSVFADENSGGYAPGESLDPTCAPGSSDCFVNMPLTVDNAYSNIFTRTTGAGAVLDGAGGGTYNIFLGKNAGPATTTGSDNIFLGQASGYSNTTGSANVFLGLQSGNSNTVGADNVFIGDQSGLNNTEGVNNTFLGSLSGYSNTTGFMNIFLGAAAGYNNDTGSQNIFFGNTSGYSNTTGSDNLFLGQASGYNNTTGYYNISIGLQAGYSNETGSNNIMIGREANTATTNTENAIAIGYGAIAQPNSVVIGNGGVSSAPSNQFLVSSALSPFTDIVLDSSTGRTRLGAIGGIGNSTTFTLDDANRTIDGTAQVGGTGGVFSVNALDSHIGWLGGLIANGISVEETGVTFEYNDGTGNSSGLSAASGLLNIYNNDGLGNTQVWTWPTVVGAAGSVLTDVAGDGELSWEAVSSPITVDGSNNIYSGTIGSQVGSGSDNVFLGYRTGYANTTGYRNIFSGYEAGITNTEGRENIFTGFVAGHSNTTGSFNIFSGTQSGYSNTEGIRNIFLGVQAGFINTTGSNNLALGYQTGDTNTEGNSNTIIGSTADVAASNTSNAIALGYGAIAATDEFALPDAITNWKFQGDSYTLPTGFGGSGSVLTDVAGNGTLSWAASPLTVDGTSNVFTGTISAGASIAGGSHNIFLGLSAGTLNTTGSLNIFSGAYAGSANIDGSYNIFSGNNAGLLNTSGSNNIFTGYLAGQTNTTGNNNTILGSTSDVAASSTTGAIAIGYGAIAASNEFALPDTITNWKFSGESYTLPLNGTLANAGVLTNDGAGVLTWETPTGDDCGSGVCFESINNGLHAGAGAGAALTTGIDGLFIGFDAGNANTSGHYNMAIGRKALYSNTTANNNTAIGDYTLFTNITGANNTAVGRSSLYNNTASNNTAIGYYAGLFNTTGTSNFFGGNQAGYSNTTGSDNILIGNNAGYSNTTGQFNTFIGSSAGYSNAVGGDYNSFIGSFAGYLNTTGSVNTFVGPASGYNNTTGYNNSFLGYASGYSNTTGANNVFIGISSGRLNTAGNNNAFIGDSVGYSNTTGSANTFSGTNAGYQNTTGGSNVFSGSQAGYSNTTGSNNVFMGNSAGQYQLDISEQVAMGYLALRGSITAADNDGINNTAIGYGAGRENIDGDYNVFVGHSAGLANTDGDYNTAVGNIALVANTTGTQNTALGQSLSTNTTGSYNTASGVKALRYNTTGSNNSAFGVSALELVAGDSNNNIGFGYQAGNNITTGDNNIIIGYDIDAPVATDNGQLSIGNLIFGNSLGETGTTVSDGNIGIGDADPTEGRLVIDSGTTQYPTGIFVKPTSHVSSERAALALDSWLVLQDSAGDNTEDFSIYDANASLQRFGIDTSGNIKMNTLTSCGGVQTNGSGVLSCTSDETLKDIKGEFIVGLDAIRGINPHAFSWREDSGLYDGGIIYNGFIAQNVQEFLPEAISISSGGKLQVSQLTLTATLVNAVKELDLTITGIQYFTDETFLSNIREWFASALNGLTKVHVDSELCIGDTCINETDLQNFKTWQENQNGGSSNAGSSGSSEILGCMDSVAENYNAEATTDDGSCTYTQIGGGEDGNTDEDPSNVIDPPVGDGSGEIVSDSTPSTDSGLTIE